MLNSIQPQAVDLVSGDEIPDPALENVPDIGVLRLHIRQIRNLAALDHVLVVVVGDITAGVVVSGVIERVESGDTPESHVVDHDVYHDVHSPRVNCSDQ